MTTSATTRTARYRWKGPSRCRATRGSRSWASMTRGRGRWPTRRRCWASPRAISPNCSARFRSPPMDRVRCWRRRSRWRGYRRRSRRRAACRRDGGPWTRAIRASIPTRCAAGGGGRLPRARHAAVVTGGTARRAMSGEATVAGRQDRNRAAGPWRCRMPGSPASRLTTATAGAGIAFAVLVEHGGYGGRAAAPIAREVVDAARELGLIP